MNSFKVLGLVCLVIVMSTASPVPQTDIFGDFLKNSQLNSPNKEAVVVKRRIFEDNPDKELKQISLSSLIGDLENSLFASAVSVNKVITDKHVRVPEIKPNVEPEHGINKRHSLDKTKKDDVATTTEVVHVSPVTDKVILQTTERVPGSNGVPAHIIIDRIAINPHAGGISLIPVFELQHSKTNDDANKEHEVNKITISKIDITTLTNTPAPETSSSTTSTSTTSTSTSTSTSTREATEVSTTPKNIEQLKEAEEELKEKVAEIEAEPIILSARV